MGGYRRRFLFPNVLKLKRGLSAPFPQENLEGIASSYLYGVYSIIKPYLLFQKHSEFWGIHRDSCIFFGRGMAICCTKRLTKHSKCSLTTAIPQYHPHYHTVISPTTVNLPFTKLLAIYCFFKNFLATPFSHI